MESHFMESLFDFTMVKMYYHVSPEGAEHPIYEISPAAFFDDEVLRETLRVSGKDAKATSLALPASFVGTSLCKLSLIQLMFAAQNDRLIDLSPDNLIYQVELHDDHAHLGYRIREVRSVPIPAEERDSFLLQHWNEYFASFITPAVEAIAATSDLKAEAIWQQFGGQISYMKDFLVANEKRKEVIEKFLNDSKLLAEHLDPALFNQRRNPYKHTPRYIENPFNPEEQWLMQSSCCMYDRRENGTKCYTCPRMKPDEREQKKSEMLANARK
jgi:ferric iron reductase protein FhuF